MQQMSGSFRLIVRRGPQPNQIYELNKDVVTIGRDITNDITINDPEVSRHHARLTRQASGYVMEDLGSTNGTFVNGQRLSGARPLQPGETIGLGETVTLAYEATAFASAMPPAPPPQPVSSYPQQPPVPTPGYTAPPAAGSVPPSAVPPTPAQRPYYADPYYAAEQQPPPSPYAYEEPSGGGGMARWLLLGCSCFIVLCVIGAVIGLIVVDQTCAWDEEPLASVLEMFNLEADSSFRACQ
jgi:hypothetical protein